MEENNITKYFVRQGIIFGLIQVIMTYLLYFINRGLMASFSVSFIFLLFVAVYPIFVVLNFRKMNDKYISLKDGFKVLFFTMSIRGLIVLVFSILLFSVIDTELAGYLKVKTLENMTAFMEKFGTPEDKISEQVNKMQDFEKQFSVLMQIKGYLYSLGIAAIYSLIVAAIVKKEKPPFTEIPNDFGNANQTT